MDGLDQILSNAIADPNDNEKFLLDYDYNLLKESYSDALDKGQLPLEEGNSELAEYLAKLEAAQDRRIEAAEGSPTFVFYAQIEKAQSFRAAGKLEDALAILDATSVPEGETEQAAYAQVRCFTQTEFDLSNGTVQWDDVEQALMACQGHGDTRAMAADPDNTGAGSVMLASLVPNPAKGQVQVQGLGNAVCTLRLMDAMGREVLRQGAVKEGSTIPLTTVAPGAYVYELMPATGAILRGRLVVQR